MPDPVSQSTTRNAEASQSALRWLADYGDSLFAYARSRVRDPATAEDLVQDTLLAALATRGQFRGESAEKTWLVGILRHKLIDHYRRQRRHQSMLEQEARAQQEKSACRHDAIAGDWSRRLEHPCEQEEFWQALDRCIGKLGATLAESFVLRVMDDLETDEVCNILEITPTNLMVRLHRARTALRSCLEQNWFEEKK